MKWPGLWLVSYILLQVFEWALVRVRVALLYF